MVAVSDYDCIVIGLGGHGSSVLAELSKRLGAKALLGIERSRRGFYEHSSSCGRSRIIRTAYFENPRYVPLLKRSFELWRELNDKHKDSQENLLTITGGLMIGDQKSVVIEGTLRSAREHDLPHRVLSSGDMRQMYPQFRLNDREIAVFERDAGYLIPELCISAYLSVAEQSGADMKFEEHFMDWHRVTDESGEDLVCVNTSCGTYHTRKLVLCVGAWASVVYGRKMGISLRLERRVLHWIEPKPLPAAASDADIFSENAMPIYIWDMGKSGSFYGFPRQRFNEGVKVAMHAVPDEKNGSEALQTPSHPENVDRRVYPAETDAMRRTLVDRIPDLAAGTFIASATCLYTSTCDGHFLIDWFPESEDRILVVSPCSGHGFKFCSVVGEIVSDLVINGSTAHDISLFKWNRLKN